MEWKPNFFQSPVDHDFKLLSPKYNSLGLGVITEEVFDNEKNTEKCESLLDSTLFESCIQWNVSQSYHEKSSVFHSPLVTSTTKEEHVTPPNSPLVTPEDVCPTITKSDLLTWAAETIKRWKCWLQEFLSRIRNSFSSPSSDDLPDKLYPQDEIIEITLKIKELEADANSKGLKITRLEELIKTMDEEFKMYQERVMEEIKLLRNDVANRNSIINFSTPKVTFTASTAAVAAPPLPPPPPPPPPPPAFLTPAQIVLTKKSSHQAKIPETPRLTITAQDLANVRLKKVSMANPKNSYVGQTVTLEQLRSVKLKPRRKIPQSQSSPTRTPLCRERNRKIRSPSVRGNTRPRIDRIPLSKILNLDDSL